MKKIGIITYHRAYNYGSALQAYALNKYIRSLGYDAQTIDYRTEGQDRIYSFYEKNSSFMSVARNIQSFLYHKRDIQKYKRFDEFVENDIVLSKTKNYRKDNIELCNDLYDGFVCGSDQIWNSNCSDFTEDYLLGFVKDKSKCFSYAPSIGTEKISDKTKELFIKNNVKEFSSLSVREKSAAELITEAIGVTPEVVIDPTLLLDREDWNKLAASRKYRDKYILCYYIGNVSGMREYARKLSKKTGLPLVMVIRNIRDTVYFNKKAYESGPKEFLSLIKNAEYICTNSFHAIIFSIVFNKKFWVFTEKGNTIKPQKRIFDFTEMTGLSDRVLNIDNCDNVLGLEDIDFEKVDNKLKPYIEKSKQYLKDALNKI